VSKEDQQLLLDYLLSTKNVSCICDLPLVSVANGEKVTISNAMGVPVYTMLTRSELDISGPCDDTAIPLQKLPIHVVATLLETGPGSVNVQRLAVPHILEYLSVYPNRLALSFSEGRKDLSAVR
jgi:hypothetical protein